MDIEEQYEKLLKYCYMKVNNRELAEDITQETFLRFWQTQSYQNMGKEMAYLYSIARNLCLDYFKKKKEDLPGDDEFFESIPDVSADVEENVTNKILVEKAMEALSLEEREIIALFFVSELSVTDIGKIIGISRFAVGRRLKTAKETLKEALKETPR